MAMCRTRLADRPRRQPLVPRIVEEMYGLALFYMHPHEHGPDSVIGAWLWQLAARIDAGISQQAEPATVIPFPLQRSRSS